MPAARLATDWGRLPSRFTYPTVVEGRAGPTNRAMSSRAPAEPARATMTECSEGRSRSTSPSTEVCQTRPTRSGWAGARPTLRPPSIARSPAIVGGTNRGLAVIHGDVDRSASARPNAVGTPRRQAGLPSWPCPPRVHLAGGAMRARSPGAAGLVSSADAFAAVPVCGRPGELRDAEVGCSQGGSRARPQPRRILHPVPSATLPRTGSPRPGFVV
jgi:hypothetical protein